MPRFEIGCVYTHNNKHFLALSRTGLAQIKNGKLIHRKPRLQYDACRRISVEELCVKWDVDLSTVDKLLGSAFIPTTTRTRTRPRGQRRKGVEVEAEFRELRTVRIARKAKIGWRD